MTRTIKPEEFISIKNDTTVVLDVRRNNDFNESNEIVSGAIWKDPANIDQWIEAVAKDEPVIIYCVRGGGVSNSVVDRLLADGIKARFIEGGIEGFKEAGCTVERK